MAEFTFYTVPMSRGQISRWALHEAGADYDHVLMDWATRPETFKDINPMNKVPALVHHHGDHDHVITEAAAINHYLAETHPDKGLLPDSQEKGRLFPLDVLRRRAARTGDHIEIDGLGGDRAKRAYVRVRNL